ncbi:DUF4347 domain-containing protein [Corallococcus caeni]|uniref:DUF4347 domain-containing protein n=1 Tax=Corallococcus caeni TaxID=3082388 RepID=A0ABQ6QQS2_9BACT|nr:hypothetical protein ASNO1_26320 [Corallococcus sp. NO1]
MGRHLTVISYLGTMDPLFEEIAFKVQPQGVHAFIRCQRIYQLHDLIMGAGRTVERLDLVGHGSPTSFWLGEDPLLEVGRAPSEVLKKIAAELPAGAEVRLLGCFTGVGEEGQTQLQSTSTILDGRIVRGTTARIEPRHFGPTGLREDYLALHSSQENGIATPTGFQADKERSLSPHLTHLPALEEADQKAARVWETYLPAGYQSLGRGRPLARNNFTFQFQRARVTFACDCRLVLIEDTAEKPPLLMGWSKPEPVPLLANLMLTMSQEVAAESADGLTGGVMGAPGVRSPVTRAAHR